MIQNTAAYCGVLAVTEFYHYSVIITGNAFTHNRALDPVPGNIGGGVICSRNASMIVSDNNFTNNSAAGDAGVMNVDESDIIIERSIFSNNMAGGNGGVLHTYFYPTRYSIINSYFIDNQAGGDGGVMYVGRAGSHVTISQSMCTFNSATNRGGVIAIIGSTLEIDRAIIFGNTAHAESGDVISACNSDVTFINNPVLLPTPDPTYSFCFLYNNSNVTISRTTEQTTPTIVTAITTDALSGASTTTGDDPLTTTTSGGITSTEQGPIAVSNSTVDSTADLTEGDKLVSTAESSESTNAAPLTTKPVVISDDDRSKNGAEYYLHYIVPGYVALGVSAILAIIVAFTCLLVIVKVLRGKPKLRNDNISVLYDNVM